MPADDLLALYAHSMALDTNGKPMPKVVINGRLTKILKVADGVIVPANSWWTGASMDFTAYDKIGGVARFETAIAISMQFIFSPDGVSSGGSSTSFTSSTTNVVGESSMILPFAALTVKNGDAALPHTLTAYINARG